MVEFKGDVAAVSQVLDGLHVVNVRPTEIYCNCCVDNVERIKFLNTSFVPERTCRLSESYGIGVEFDPFEGWSCDRCGMIVSYDPDKPNYCPHCGAKVVK